MKKYNALTLIEVLLVLAVIALILLATVSQIQRYQSTRNTEQAQASVKALSNFTVNLYLANCHAMLTDTQNYFWTAENTSNTFFNSLPKIINPFYKEARNYVIGVYIYDAAKTRYYRIPRMLVALPVSVASLGKTTTQQTEMLKKYIAVLQPSVIAASSNTGGVFSQAGIYGPDLKPYSSQKASDDPCLSSVSGAAMCLEWYITPDNWGMNATGTTNNQMQDIQLNATITQYIPNKATYGKMQKNTDIQAECTAIVAAHQYDQSSSP